MSIQYTTNTRSDIAISGEILPSDSAGTGGTVFVLTSVFRNRLYYLLRWNGGTPGKFTPYYRNSNDPSEGIITNVNEYAWVESGITYYIKDINQVPNNFIPDLPSGNNPEANSMNMWSRDYFKWRKDSKGNIFFDIYSDPQGTRRAVIYKDRNGNTYSKPTLKYEIFEPFFNVCKVISSSNSYKTNKFFFMPHFIVSEDTQTFINDTINYPGCNANNGIFYPTNSGYKCSTKNGKYNDQNSGSTYSLRLLTDDPPGIDVLLSPNTRLWAGVTYHTDVDPHVYSGKKATGMSDGHQEETPTTTRMFSQQVYYEAAGTVANSLGGGYGGLPNGFRIKMNGNKNSLGAAADSTFQFYKYSKGNSYCGAGGNEINTTYSSEYIGFKFILIPIDYFTASGCESSINPIISYCPSMIKSGKTTSEFYTTYCTGNPSGFTNKLECTLNQGSQPYYYPKFAYNGTNVVNLSCGKTYNDVFEQGTFTSIPNNNLTSIFGDTLPLTAVNYNNSNPGGCSGNFVGCCARPSKTSNPAPNCDAGTCNGGIIICSDGNTDMCTFVDPRGIPICDSETTSDCVKVCTPSSSPVGCETINCADYTNTNLTPYPGCINECTDGVDGDCYYYSEVLQQWICGSSNYPPGCVNPNTEIIPCNPSGIGDYPGCVKACETGQTPSQDGCNYYIQDPDSSSYIWICDENNQPEGCKELCSVDSHPTGCVSVFCDNNDIEGCIPTCTDGQTPKEDGCVYYTGGEWICTDTNFPEGCIDMCTTIDPFTGSPTGCKAITCDSDGYPSGCVPRINNPTACTSDNTPAGCVWKTGDKFICKSINNPDGCVYMLDSNNKPPSWSMTDCKIEGECVKVMCDANNNPPGCISSVTPDETTGMSVWVWVVIVLGIVFVLAIGGGIIYFMTKKKKPQNPTQYSNTYVQSI